MGRRRVMFAGRVPGKQRSPPGDNVPSAWPWCSRCRGCSWTRSCWCPGGGTTARRPHSTSWPSLSGTSHMLLTLRLQVPEAYFTVQTSVLRSSVTRPLGGVLLGDDRVEQTKTHTPPMTNSADDIGMHETWREGTRPRPRRPSVCLVPAGAAFPFFPVLRVFRHLFQAAATESDHILLP